MRSGSVLGKANLGPSQYHPCCLWVEAEQDITWGGGLRKLSKIKEMCLSGQDVSYVSTCTCHNTLDCLDSYVSLCIT